MTKQLKIICGLVFLLIVSVTGCMPKQMDIDPERLMRIKAIGIIPPANPTQIGVIDTSGIHVGRALGGVIGGAIGDMIADKDAAERTAMFAKAIDEYGFDFSQQMTTSLQETLTNSGFRTQIIKIQKPAMDQFITDYNALATPGLDAYLDVAVFTVDFYSDLNIKKLIPRLYLDIKLVSTSDYKLLYRKWFLFGPQPNTFMHHPTERSESMEMSKPTISPEDIIPAPSKYQFNEFDDLMARKKDAVEGLRYGINQIAQKIGNKIIANPSSLSIYRPSIFMTNRYGISIIIDHDTEISLNNSSHVIMLLQAGKHVIRIKGGKSPDIIHEIDTQQNQSYYLKVEIPYYYDKSPDLLMGKYQILSAFVPSETGAKEIKKTKRTSVKKK